MEISTRQHRPKSLSESIAKLEESLFEAEQKGNTMKVKALKLVLKRLKKNVEFENAASLHQRTGKKNKA